MNGPSHYREAERQIAPETLIRCRPGSAEFDAHIAVAQVHATLALTAATMARNMPLMPAGRHEWQKAIDPEYAAEQAAEVTR